MRVRAPFATTAAWGCACGALLGALRTRAATLHLLQKNHALLAAGVPPLPGAGHWAEMASPAPTAAGAVFFGLSLGLGAGALLALWVVVARRLGGPRAFAASWTVLFPSLWAAFQNDAGLAAALAAIGAGAALLQAQAPQPSPRSHPLAVACAVVTALGLVPWALAPEGGFTRFRDRVLFRSELGLALDRLYYRWTLYPAEALKPLAGRSQPTVAPSPQLPPDAAAAFCREARPAGLLCVAAGSPGGDATAVPGASGAPVLAAPGARIPWPRDASTRPEAWQLLSRASDRAVALRSATGLALLAGCPAALLWLAGVAASRLRAVAPSGRRGIAASVAAAALVAGGLAALARSDPGLARARSLADAPRPSRTEVEGFLRSPDPAARYYAARAAAALGPAAERALLSALGDPVVNVRYAAAQSLGAAGTGRARQALLRLVEGPDEWYVKERAYAALERLGWDAGAR
ncbi:MAG: HEAT repeat domain-containing protein [Deltaproteobacteria bacterium]|nr:HEAT repeat domain-containing protein [Deltaproteobacteria bacterium]